MALMVVGVGIDVVRGMWKGKGEGSAAGWLWLFGVEGEGIGNSE